MTKNTELFLSFAKVGLMTFGGGYAMLPIMQREIAENKKWATSAELADYFAIAQCTPGAIAVNTATFVGQKQNKILGGIFATLGVVFPSLIIICIVAGFINNFSDLPYVRYAFNGIRVCVCVLVFNAVCKLWKDSVKDKFTFLIFIIVLLLSVITNLSPVIYVISTIFLGIILEQFKIKKGGHIK